MDNADGMADGGLSDRALVARAAGGETDAFDALVRTRLDRLYVTANRIVRDSAAAEDVVQQALVLAWRDLHALRDQDRFDAWLYRLLVRACYRELRSRRRWISTVVDLGEVRTAGTDMAIHERDALERAFRRLTPEKRVVIVLHHVTGLALTEISAVLELPQGTIRSRLHYGLEELRRALAPDAALDGLEEPA